MSKPKPKYKNRQTLIFKGVTWKFSSYYGEWHPPKGADYKKLPTIFEYTGRWNVGSSYGDTPLEALKAWVRDTIEYHESCVFNFQKVVQTHKDAIKRFKTRSWQSKTGKK